MNAAITKLTPLKKEARFKNGDFSVFCPSSLPMRLSGGEELNAEICGTKNSSIVNITYKNKEKILITGKFHLLMTKDILLISTLKEGEKEPHLPEDSLAFINLKTGEVSGPELEYEHKDNKGTFFIRNQNKKAPITIRIPKVFSSWKGVPTPI